MKRLIVGVVALAGLLGACSADETDYRDAAEKYIRDQLGDDAKAECQDPASTAVGTIFTCTGTDAAGATTSWEAQITKKDEVGVNGPLDAAAPADSTPVDTTPVDTTPATTG